MSIVDSFDDSEEIVKPEIFTEGLKKLPEIAIVCFKTELIEYVKKSSDFEEYSDTLVLGDNIKIYKTVINNRDVILYRTLMGGPACNSIMEELHSRGVNKFIFFGSCGKLTSELKKGAFIIPAQAYRDEGVSYHYMPVSDFIDVNTAEKLKTVFDKNNIPYELTKTWTTDAIYKETVNKIKDRVSKGCTVVEIECASIMSVSKSRGFMAYEFLYTEDTLDGELWNMNELRDDRSALLKECLRISLIIADEI